MKSIYTYYKERLIEISGRNRSLYAKKISKKFSYDIGKVFEGDFECTLDFSEFLWRGRKYSYPIIKKEDKNRLYVNLGVESKLAKQYLDVQKLEGKEKSSASLKLERTKQSEIKRSITSQITSLNNLKREMEEFHKETGRSELFIGYPFVVGAIGKDMVVKAPLLLFPASIDIADESTVEVVLKKEDDIQLNKVFVLAYAKYHKLNVDDMEMEFGSNLGAKFKSIQEVVEYLRGYGFKIAHSPRKGLTDFEKIKEPSFGDPMEVKYSAVIGRFPLANSIYNDYTQLEKQKLTNDAIDELLNRKQLKPIKKPDLNLYTINPLDYAQEQSITDLNKFGNMVIYGPPGTGKSQTIVNIITDALAKNKRVLVVSQKKAALEVVYNRLGNLNSKSIFLTDPEKNKSEFYEKAITTHKQLLEFKPSSNIEKFKTIENNINNELNTLQQISQIFFEITPFGLSLQQMYASSYMIGKRGFEYDLYKSLLQNEGIMKLTYQELKETLRLIQEKNKGELYYNYLEDKKVNPLIDNVKDNLDIHTINQAKTAISNLLTARFAPFETSKYPNSRQLIAYYFSTRDKPSSIKPIVKFVSAVENPSSYRALKATYILFPFYPFAKFNTMRKEKRIKQNFTSALSAIENYISDYEFLKEILIPEGYLMMIDNLLNGNTLSLRLLLQVLNDYVNIREQNLTIKTLNSSEKLVLNFAYTTTNTIAKYNETLQKILNIRIYHETVKIESERQDVLFNVLDYDNIRNRIMSLKNEQMEESRKICSDSFKLNYNTFYKTNSLNKDFLYQISKQKNHWPIRKMMEVFPDFLFNMFPCWLLSPEGASTIMPLQKDLFDIVLFDEASQVFIENTLPIIYRSKTIVVAGDSKQLRPTSNFMKRYFGNDLDDDTDYSTQAALEVESLLDLAVARYNNTNLKYHYRSIHEELINFSNNVFYEGKLEVAPNTQKNVGKLAIERILVEDGRWINRRNDLEAKEIVSLLKKTFRTRKNNETIGIITFNAEQGSTIQDLIDEECKIDAKFRDHILKEQNRKNNDEDVSLFVKNIENVQGDERDIIIFSIGYAKNENGRVVSHFGPLSVEGGENRLNVAITRAVSKIYIVTSIEPEDLKVENTKNQGPKIFKTYMAYAKAISNGNYLEAKLILGNYHTPKESLVNISKTPEIELKIELEKQGFIVDTNLGNSDYKINLAIYDKVLKRYLVGVEFDYNAYEHSANIIERDVYRPNFLNSRGWNIVRVWSRDWWLNKRKIVNQITRIANAQKKKLSAK